MASMLPLLSFMIVAESSEEGEEASSTKTKPLAAKTGRYEFLLRESRNY